MGVVIALLVVVGIVWLAARSSRRGNESRSGEGGGVEPRVVVEASRSGSLGGRASREEERAEREEERLRDLLHDLTGEFLFDSACSPDGRFVVGAQDGVVGKPGVLALVDAQARKKLYVMRLRRPNHPSVSNGGVVVVQSWTTGSELASDLRAFSPDGSPLWSFRLKANMDESGISPGGTRSFCTTLTSPKQPDFSRRLFFLDAGSGEVLWAQDSPECPLRFEGEELVGDLTVREGEVFVLRYGEGGSVGEEGELALLRREMAWWGADKALVPRVREALNATLPRLEEAERLLGLVDLAQLEPVPRGKLLRLRGELCEARGEVAAAVDAYREALALYPRAGVKGRLEALERRLA